MKGWIKSIRESKGLRFIAVTDGQHDHQLTVKTDEALIVGNPKVGASFVAEGFDSITPRGFAEFVVSKLTIIGESADDFPIQPKYHTPEFLRTIPELRGKTKILQATWKIRHHLTQAIHRFLEDEGFYQYYTPIITQADCEGAGETFDVTTSWMEEKLTVSGQLHGEVGMQSLGKVYAFSPCFRAEKSQTKKHLSEFWMVEPEIAFFELDETIEFAERFVKSVIKYVIGKSEYEFKQLGIDIQHLDVIDKDWKVAKYDEVVEKFKLKWGEDISSEVEKKIVKVWGPTFVVDYPEGLKPFYMKKDGRVAKCFDLIFPEVGELIGGSQREEDYDKIVEQMTKAHLDLEKMKWYLATRKWGTVPHSGFGLGFERLLMFITKATKIHDVIPFPVSY